MGQGGRRARLVLVFVGAVALLAGCGSAESVPSFRVAELMTAGGSTPSVDNDDLLIDSGGRSTVVLHDNTLYWIGVIDDQPWLKPMADLVPGFDERVASGFNQVAACGEVIVVSLRQPDELVAVHAGSGVTEWVVPQEDDRQIGCGDADVLIVQTRSLLSGLDLTDGTERWSRRIDVDDPLRLGPAQAVVGSYDGVLGLDLATGETLWTNADAAATSLNPSGPGTVIGGLAGVPTGSVRVVAADGSVAFEVSGDDLSDRFAAFVAGSAGAEVLVDPEEGTVIDDDGVRSLLSDEVARVLGPGPDGLIWAVVVADDGTARVGLVDTDGALLAVTDAGAGSASRESRGSIIALPWLVVVSDTGQALIPAG